MPTVLVTAFEPYDCWPENSSWLTLVELTKNLPDAPAVTTRLYPVDVGAMRKRLSKDLEADYDYALHLGQAPGAACVRLEAIGINVVGGGSRFSRHASRWCPKARRRIRARSRWPTGRRGFARWASRAACRTMQARLFAMRPCIYPTILRSRSD